MDVDEREFMISKLQGVDQSCTFKVSVLRGFFFASSAIHMINVHLRPLTV